MRHKVCFFNQSPVHYRKEIFMLMDQELDIDFYFGDSRPGGIASMDVGLLNHFRGYYHNINLGRFYWQSRAVGLLWSNYTDLFTTGTHNCLSAWLIILLAPLFGKRVYLWSHGAYGDERGLKRWLTRWKMNRVTASLLYGEYARRLLLEMGVKASKLHVFYNSLAYDEQIVLRRQMQPSPLYKSHFGNSRPNLVFIGRLTKTKRLELILEAMSLLRQKGCEVNTTFIGSGEAQEMLQAKAIQAGLEQHVWFYGPCYNERLIAELLYNADLCVSPGNVGLTAIHAMTFGTPVITHNNFVRQMPEFEAIEEGITGDFFTEGSGCSLADCIRQWLLKGLDREATRQACYRVIDTKYNPHEQIKAIRNVIFKD